MAKKHRKRKGGWKKPKVVLAKKGYKESSTLLDTIGGGEGNQRLRKGKKAKRLTQAQLDTLVAHMIGGQQ